MNRRNRSRRFVCAIEPLENRVLLAAAGDAIGRLDWQGESVLARAGQWIVHTSQPMAAAADGGWINPPQIPPNRNPDVAHSASLTIDSGTVPFPGTWTTRGFAAGLIYRADATASIRSSSDIVNFTVLLDAGQMLSVLGRPSAGLAAAIQLRDPIGMLIASDAGIAGSDVLLQTVAVPVQGQYTITISSNSGTGQCDLVLVLNAAIDSGVHDTLATAQDIDGSITALPGAGERGGVLSEHAAPMASLLVADFDSGPNGFTIDNSGGGLWHLSVGHGDEPSHSPRQSFYYGQAESATGGGNYSTGERNGGAIVSPELTLPGSGRITLDFNYLLETEKRIGYDLARLQINAGGNWSTLATYSTTAESPAWMAASTVDLSAYAGKAVRLRWFFDTVDASTNQYEGWYVDDIVVRAQGRSAEYYRFSLNAGQSATLALSGLGTDNVEMALVSAAGQVLATGLNSSTEISRVISRVQAEATGTYYVRVEADGGTNYSLVVTRDADIEAEPNDLLSEAQEFGPSGVALGSLNDRVLTLAAEDFEGGALGPAWSTYGSETGGRIQVSDAYGQGSGAYALLMDRTPGGQDVLNEATWTVQLASATGVKLSFWHVDFKDDPHPLGGDFMDHANADGIAFSGDGVHWHPAWEPPDQKDGVWQRYEVDLGVEAAKHGVSLSGQLRIRFQQYDNRELAEDGRGWDGIAITGSAPVQDVYVLHAGAGDRLELMTSTPADGPWSFANDLVPVIELFDPLGDLLASNSGGAADGRNAKLSWIAQAAGDYRVRVSAAGGTRGQYILAAGAVPSPVPAPGRPDLLPVSDTGISSADNLTKLDNSSQANALMFLVAGTVRGATVTIYSDGAAIGSTIARSSSALVRTGGTWDLADGSHTITARQRLPGQAESVESAALDVVVDTVRPAGVAMQLAESSDTGLSSTDRITADNTPTFAMGGAAFYRIVHDGTPVVQDYASGDSCTLPAQPDGTWIYRVIALDAAGNESVLSAPVALTIDTVVPPAPSLPDLPSEYDSGLSNQDNITNRGTIILRVSGGAAYWRVYRNGTRMSGFYESGDVFAPPALADGKHAFSLTAVDTAGNESASGNGLAVFIDTQAPGLPPAPDLQAASDGGAREDDNITNDTTPTFDLPGAAYLRFYRNGAQISGDYEPGNTFTTGQQAAGTYQYSVVYVDAAGNASAMSAAVAVTIDPTILQASELLAESDSGISPSDRLTRFNNASAATALQVLVHGTTAGAMVKIYADGVVIGSAAATSSITRVVSDGVTTLADGERLITARQTLPGQAEGGDSTPLRVTIDTQAPAAPPIPDLDAASDSGVSSTDNITNKTVLTLNLPAGVHVRVYQNGQPVTGDYTAGAWTTAAPGDGVYDFAVAAVDGAGNVSEASVALRVIVDTVAPKRPGPPDLQASRDSGVFDNDDVTSVTSPTFDVMGEPYFRLYSNGNLISGLWEGGTSFRATALADGMYLFTATAVDPAGNESAASEPLIVTVDTRPPALHGGALDTSWDGDGIARTTVGSGGWVLAMARQADGKIVAVGAARTAETAFGLVRYNTDGSLDQTFGNGGIVISQFRFKDEARAVAIQPDGKIVVGGYSAAQIIGGYSTRFALARYNTNGALDTSFGSSGIIITNIGTSQSIIESVTVLPTERILVAGYGWNQGDPDFALARYMPNGDLDGEFGSGGMVLTDIGGQWDEAHDLAVLPDGRFVVVGWAAVKDSYTIGLARYNPDGTLDASFDGDGKLTTHIGTYNDYGNAVKLDADGRIVVAGTTFPDYSTPSNLVVLRYNPDGGLDRGFGGAGHVTTSMGLTYDGAADVAIDQDGRTLAAGTTVDPATRRVALTVVRYATNGALDGDFGVGGVVITQVDYSSGSRGNAMLVEPNGQVLVGGISGATGNGGFAVVRYDGGRAPRPLDLTAASDSGVSASDNITNVAEPLLSIPATDQYYRVYANGNRISGAYQIGSRNGSTYRTPRLADGTYAFTITLVDAAGNPTPASGGLNVTIDTIAPATSSAADLHHSSDTGLSNRDHITNDNTPTFAINAGPYYRVRRNGIVISGSYENGPTYTAGVVPDGSHGFTVVAADEAGNESAPSAAEVVVIDTAAPAAPVVNLQATSDSGVSNTDRITNVQAPVFGVNVAEPGLIELAGDGQTVRRQQAAAGGAHSLPLSGFVFNTQNPFVTQQAQAIRTADVNRDGRPDVITADANARTVSIHLGNGDGTFQPRRTLSTIGDAMDVADADFNRDGNPDLAATNGIDHRVSVFLGNGDGSFQSERLYPASPNATTICVVDINNDANPDILTNDLGNARAAVLLGNGDGTFQPVRLVPSVFDGWRLFTGDFDRDGNADFAALGRNTNTVAVYLGDGDATFAGPVNYSTGAFPIDIGGGDFDGDGILDLLAADQNGDSASVLPGNGDGTFQARQSIPLGFSPRAVSVADFDGDGKLDFAVASNAGRTVAMVRGRGNGTFDPPVSFAMSFAPMDIGGADFNLDGATDFVAVGGGLGTVLLSSNRVYGDGVHSVVAWLHDVAGNRSAASAPVSITIDRAAPTADIVDVTPDPRDRHVDPIVIGFTESVWGLDLSAVALTRNGGANLLTTEQPLAASSDRASWSLTNLAGLTFVRGNYNLRLTPSGSKLTDAAGNALTIGADDRFAVTTSVVPASDGNDAYQVRLDAAGKALEFFHNKPTLDRPSYAVALAGLAGELGFETLGGDDVLTVDRVNGDPLTQLAVRVITGRISLKTAGTDNTIRMGNLLLGVAAAVDLGSNRLILGNASLDQVRTMVRSARDFDPPWTGYGLGSSAAQANPNTGLVPVQAGSDVVVKYAWNGDANLDGVVNADDYFQIDSGFLIQPSKPAYSDGDFNLDGVVNADDYFLIDSGFLAQTGPLGSEAAAGADIWPTAAWRKRDEPDEYDGLFSTVPVLEMDPV